MRDDPRNGGAVLRYHTWRTLQSQSVAEHSWNVARILMTVWPEAPADALRYALLHDVGELVTGDAPFPVKMENPVLKREMDRLEDVACQEMGISGLMDTTDRWHMIVKICDMIEMWEFGLEETSLGNMYAWPIVTRTEKMIQDLCRRVSVEGADRAAVREYMQWRTMKTPARR